MDNRQSSYVLSKEERRDVSTAKDDFNKNSFLETPVAFEESLPLSKIAYQEENEDKSVDESSS